MTMLKLREGWQSVTVVATTYLWPPEEIATSNGWYVDLTATEVAAYPHGELQAQVFNTIEEAHAYLIESGSESPWEEVC